MLQNCRIIGGRGLWVIGVQRERSRRMAYLMKQRQPLESRAAREDAIVLNPAAEEESVGVDCDGRRALRGKTAGRERHRRNSPSVGIPEVRGSDGDGPWCREPLVAALESLPRASKLYAALRPESTLSVMLVICQLLPPFCV